MKICFFYKTITKPWGGANTFLLHLNKYLKSQKVNITCNPNSSYDILFLNGAYRGPGKLIDMKDLHKLKNDGYSSTIYKMLNGFKKRSIKSVLRLDGLRKIYANIDSKMDEIQLECLKIADFIIFQSQFSLECFQQMGFKGSNYKIIHNGVDTNIFNESTDFEWKDERKPIKLISCSWSSNPYKGHEVVACFSELSDVEVSYIGNWPASISSKKVHLLGPKTQNEMAILFKKSHGFLFPSKHEACPNTLIEALASGLPVIYLDSGGTKEIASRFGVPLNDDIEYTLKEFKKYYSCAKKALREHMKTFSIEYSGSMYLEVFNQML